MASHARSQGLRCPPPQLHIACFRVGRACWIKLHQLSRTNVTNLLKECNTAWSAAWDVGGAVCGDKAIVPHNGGRCLRRSGHCPKPHATGKKLYVFVDSTADYVMDVYLYMGCQGKRIIRLWTRLIPPSTMLVANSFFGSHGMAQDLIGHGHAFLVLTKKDKQDARAPALDSLLLPAHCAWYGALKAKKTMPQVTGKNLWEQVHFTPRPHIGRSWETRTGNKNRDIVAKIMKM